MEHRIFLVALLPPGSGMGEEPIQSVKEGYVFLQSFAPVFLKTVTTSKMCTILPADRQGASVPVVAGTVPV